MFVYRYPGDQIEYLEGKSYDIKKVDDGDELTDALVNGWALSPDEAEALTAPPVKTTNKTKAEV